MSTLLAIALVHVVAVISPGANFLIVTRNALSFSRRSGLLTARGVALGSFIYIVIGFLGFATIISHSPLLFNAIRLVGAAYFLYTGSKALLSLRQRPTLAARMDDTTLPERRAFLGGLATALSNATSILYFLSLFTTFIPTEASPIQKAATALVLVSISLTWYTLVALTFSNPRVRRIYSRFERWLNGLIGLLWIGLALKLLSAR